MDNKYCSTCFRTGEELDEALQKALKCDNNAARAEAAADRAEQAGKANEIVCTASGVGCVTVNDSAERPLRGLNIYGKTTQQTFSGKNLFHRDYEKTETTNGVTFHWDAETQELVLNGTVNANGDLKLVNPLKLDWVTGETYTVSVRHTGGSATLVDATDGGTNFGWSIFSTDLKKYMRGTLGNAEFPELYSFSGNAIEASGGAYVFYFQCWKVGTVFDNYRVKVQIESGNTPTDWEPYTGGIPSPNPYYPQELTNTNGAVIVSVIGEDKAYYQALWHIAQDGLPGIPVSADGNYTDVNGQQWICDEIDFKRGVYIQRVGKRVFDGSESWKQSAASECVQVQATVSDVLPGTNSITRLSLICSQFTASYDHVVGHCYFEGNTFSCNPYEVGAGTVSDWKVRLAEHPMTIVYVLAAPIETPLPAEEFAAFAELHSFYPTTSVCNENGADMAIEYVADTKNYIDKKFAELRAAVVSG